MSTPNRVDEEQKLPTKQLSHASVQLQSKSNTMNRMMSVIENPVKSIKPEEIDFTLGSQSQDIFLNGSSSSVNNSLDDNHYSHISNNRQTMNPKEQQDNLSPKKMQKEEIEGTNKTIIRETSKSLLLDQSGTNMKVRLNIVPKQNPICNVHPDLKVNLFCRDCERNVCVSCFNTDEHKDHQYEEIDKFLEFKKATWSQFFQEQRSQVRHNMQGVDFVTWSTLDQELKEFMSDPFAKQKSILLNLEEFENSIAKMISQHNIKKLLNHDARRDHITRAIYDFQQDINQFKTVNHLNNKIQKSEHLLEIESQLKALISKEIEDFKSINQQELQYTTNKIIQLESEIIPQLEQQQKQYNSNDDLTQIKKSQTDIVSTVKDLLKLKDMRIKDQNEVKTLEKQFKDFVFEFEKLRDQIGGVQGNVRTEMRKLQTDIDKDQNKKIDEMITRILLIEKELNIKIQGGFEKNQQIEVNINTMIESLKDSIDQQQDEIIKKHGLMIEQNEQNDALVREQLKLLQIDVESLQDHQIAINKKNDTLSIIVDKAYARLDLLEGQLKHYIQSEVERRQMSWEIESGEEAEIQQQHLINTLVLLSNQMVVSSSSQALQNKHYLEVFDSDNDYEMLKTILTYHEGNINCMIEHNKVLLTGSYDHSIGIWDIYNDFQQIQQISEGNEVPITCLTSVDNRYFIQACNQGSLKIWDSVGYKQVCNKQQAHRTKINSVQLISKYRLISCSNDKNATSWQLQGSNMTKLCDFPHNSFVVSAQELNSADQDLLLTCTMQGYIFIWNMQQSQSQQIHGNQAIPLKTFKLEAPKSVLQTMLIQDYDYKLFPFVAFKTLNEVYVLQVTTGKQVKVQLNSFDMDLKNNKGGELEKYSEQKKMLQVDQSHIIIADGNKIKVVSMEVNVSKDSLITSSQNRSIQSIVQKSGHKSTNQHFINE
eukprot:403376468